MKTEYTCNDESIIYFGKFKGKPHKVLKDEENFKYCQWIMDTEPDFAKSTKVYIKDYVFV